jgi:phage tail-like protein
MTFIFRISGPDSSQEYTLPLGKTTIGREKGREIILAHPLVSRLHAQLICGEQDCVLTDLGSANGTLVGETMLTPQAPYTLQPGDKVTIGPFELVFEQIPTETLAEAAPEVEISVAEAEPVSVADQAPSEPQAPEELEQAQAANIEPADKAPAPPPLPPSLPPEIPPEGSEEVEESPVPLGLSIYSTQLIQYLPGIYQTEFMSRFLALFESVLVPLEWNVDNFDLFLDPGTAPFKFLPWLAGWFELTFDASWSDAQRRALLKDAYRIFARHGTRWALSRVLEIYTGYVPEIVDTDKQLEPHTFMIRFPFPKSYRRQELLEKIIDAHKPAHTTYTLKFKGMR